MDPGALLVFIGLLFFNSESASSAVCDVNIDPSRVVVRFGDPVTVNCSTTREDVMGSGWESSVSPVNEPESKIAVWNVSSLTVWDAEPKCFINYMNEPRQCAEKLDLVIYKYPESVSLIAPGFMKIGVESNITCQVLDVAPIRYLSVKLYKGDEQLGSRSFTHDSTRFPVNESVPFPVTPTRADNGSEYTCVAELQLGPRSPPLKIPVFYKPSLLSADEENVEVREGGSIVLKCSADGSPAPTYEWKYPKADNVQEITKDGVSTVNITRASSSNARVYECHAKNTYGVATKNITVTVKDQVIITGGAASPACDVNMDPSRVVVRFGDPVSVNCSTTREDVLGSGWESSVSPVKEQKSKIAVWNVSSLTVWDVESKCFINYMNEPRQCVEKLDLVIYKYPESVSLIAPDFMKIGEESNITCQVLDVAPIRYLTVKLYKGDEQLGNSSFTHDSTRFPVNESVSFPVTPTRADNGAEYTCVAELQLGPRSPPLKIPVFYKPSVINSAEESVPVLKGDSVVFNCTADGIPAPTYTWKHPEADNVKITTKDSVSTVTITGASSSNHGVYECHAWNIHGNSTRKVTVEVTGNYILLLILVAVAVVAVLLVFFVYFACKKKHTTGRYTFLPTNPSSANGSVAENGQTAEDIPLTTV